MWYPAFEWRENRDNTGDYTDSGYEEKETSDDEFWSSTDKWLRPGQKQMLESCILLHFVSKIIVSRFLHLEW